MQPLGPDDGQAGVGIPQHQHRVRPQGHHQVIGLGNDVAHGLPQRISHRVQIHLRIGQLQVVEKHTVQIVVIVLPRVGQDGVEVVPTFGDHRSQTDDLRPGPDDDKQF